MGDTGENSSSWNFASASSPSRSAAVATIPRLLEYIAARRTVASGQFGGRGNGVDHDAGQRALPQLSDQETQQELLLRRRRAREQFLQSRCAPRRGSAAAHAGEFRQLTVNFGDRERRRIRGRRGRGCAHRRIADADFSLGNLAREIVHADIDFVGRQQFQERGQFADFDPPRGGCAHALRGSHELG